MNTYIGIDLGTSGVKLLIMRADGEVLGEITRNYPISHAKPNWSEQNPNDWWMAIEEGLEELLIGQDREAVKGISFAGQMHGLVALDSSGEVIRPCILWNDGRTEAETAYLNETIGREKLSALTGNIAFAGFTAPKLLWLRENEPENFEKIDRILLPKDYIAYKFTGEFCTDYSDASGMLLLDVENKRWSEEMLVISGICRGQLPKLMESYGVVGTIKEELSVRFGLGKNCKVVIGAGDNAAAAIGTGTVGEGKCNISLGTSGTIFLSSDKFTVDEKNALHSFCHADGGWHLMGCILSAASCRKWWIEDILGSSDYKVDEEEARKACCDGLLFLPYLSGERSPHNDVNARGAFIGLTATTTRAQMSRAVMEGVAFALRDCMEVAKSNGVLAKSATICGGGAKSGLWREIMANVLNLPVSIQQSEHGPTFGAAMLAMVGCGEYPDIATCVESLVSTKDELLPDPDQVAKYNKAYSKFKQLYPLLKTLKS